MPPRSANREATPARQLTPYVHDVSGGRSSVTPTGQTSAPPPMRTPARGSVSSQDVPRTTRSTRSSRCRGEEVPDATTDPEEIMRANRAASRQGSVVSNFIEPARPQNQHGNRRDLPVIVEEDNAEADEEDSEGDKNDEAENSDLLETIDSGEEDDEDTEEDCDNGDHEPNRQGNILLSIEQQASDDDSRDDNVRGIFAQHTATRSQTRRSGRPMPGMNDRNTPLPVNASQPSQSKSRSRTFYSATSWIGSMTKPSPGPGHGRRASSKKPSQDSSPADAANGLDGIPLSFWEIFWQQVVLAWGYVNRKRTIVTLIFGIFLFYRQLCSAGPICQHFHWRAVMSRYLTAQPLQASCSVLINTLLFLGGLDFWGSVFLRSKISDGD